MTVKSTISFTDRHHSYVKRKVQEGAMPSVSSLVAMGLEQMMQDEADRDLALQAMQSSIQSRMDTPRAEWREGTDDLVEKARLHLLAK